MSTQLDIEICLLQNGKQACAPCPSLPPPPPDRAQGLLRKTPSLFSNKGGSIDLKNGRPWAIPSGTMTCSDTHRRARQTLKSSEASVSLQSPLARLSRFSFVTSRALRALCTRKTWIQSSLGSCVSHLVSLLCRDSVQDAPILTGIPRAPAGPEGPIGPCAPCEGRERTTSGKDQDMKALLHTCLGAPRPPEPGATSRCSTRGENKHETPPATSEPRILTDSPLSPCLPVGPAGPGEPGGPGAPGAPSAPVSPRSPCRSKVSNSAKKISEEVGEGSSITTQTGTLAQSPSPRPRIDTCHSP